LDTVTQRILDKFNHEKAESIYAYEVVEGYELDSARIFEAEAIDPDLFEQEKKVYETREANRRAVNKYYRMDSKGEYDFAQELDQNQNVLLFTKLKKGGFVIDTPFGDYSPDWAIVYRKAEDENVRLYFIVETKADKKEVNLTTVERLKIKCGQKHFEAVSSDVTFDWVNSYDDFKRKFDVSDSI
jgi:type III restriction enzyme